MTGDLSIHKKLYEKEIYVFRLEENDFLIKEMSAHKENNFYKILLLKEEDKSCYSAASLKPSEIRLLFYTPGSVKWSDQYIMGKAGFICLFSSSFFTVSANKKLNGLPMYRNAGKAYPVNEPEGFRINEIFNRMLEEINSGYAYKYDLLRNYILEVIHVVFKSLYAAEIVKTPYR